MSWKDRKGPATFRGVPFFVESLEVSGGRRTVAHEYPFKNKPFTEDMGRKARTYPVEGYVIGVDYIAARDALITALEDEGPGELVHPLHGSVRVIVADFRVRESQRDGGMAQFSIEFQESEAASQPTAVLDAAGQVAVSSAAARAASAAEFLAKYSPGTLMESVSDSMRSATLAVNRVLSKIEMEEQKLALFNQRTERLLSSVDSLVEEPEELLEELTDLFADFEEGAVNGLIELYGYDPGVRPPDTTANRAIEQINFDSLQWLFQRLALIRAVELAIAESYASYDDAITRRSALTDLLDEQADSAADDVYPELLQLRADLTKAIPGEEGDLPRLVSHTPHVTIPSLVLTYQLYGELSLESDLLARNHVRHPGFVPGDRELEVLSDA